jgi:hypothetical protein
VQSSNQGIGGSVLGNQTPSAPILEETMARRKVTAGEAQRMKKIREIKQRKNRLKAEADSDPIEVMDLKIVSALSFTQILNFVYVLCYICARIFIQTSRETPLCITSLFLNTCMAPSF